MRLAILMTISTLCFLERSIAKNVQSFYLHASDVLSIDVDNFLPKHNPLNSLQTSHSDNLIVDKPNSYKTFDVAYALDPEVEKSIIASSNYSNNIVYLYKLEGSNPQILHLKFDVSSKEISTNTIEINGFSDCQTVNIDHENIYVGCLNPDVAELVYCTADYTLNTMASCEPINIPSGSVEHEKLRMAFTTEPTTLFAFYFSHSQNADLADIVILSNTRQKGVVRLDEPAGLIEKLSIVEYNQSTGEVILLVLFSTGSTKTLKHYVLENFFIEDNDTQSRVLSTELDDYVFGDNSMLLIKIKPDYIEVSDNDMKDLSYETFKFENQKAVKDIKMANHFFVMETLDSNNDNQVFIIDNLNKRMFNVDEVEKGSGRRMLLAVDAKTYVFEFKGDRIKVLELMRFKYINARLKEGSESKSESINFSVDNKKIYSLHLVFKSFDYKTPEIKDMKTLSLCKDPGISHIHLNSQGNNLDFGESANISYFNRLDYDKGKESKFSCDSIGFVVKRNLVVRLCRGYHLLILKDMEITPTKPESDAKELGFSKIFTLDIGELSSEINVIKIFYQKFVVLLDEYKTIYFVNINIDPARMNLNENSILTSYEDCIIDKYFFICLKDGAFHIIKAHYDGDELFFKVERVLNLPLALYETITVSKFDEHKLYYVRKSSLNDDVHYIEFNTNGVLVKNPLSSLKLTDSTLIAELYTNQLLIFNPDTSRIDVWINNSLVSYSPLPESSRVLDYKIQAEVMVFSILYCDIDNNARLYVGRSSLLVYNRQIKDIKVGSCDHVSQLEMALLSESQLLLVLSSNGEDRTESYYTFDLNGPLYLYDNKSVHQISFELNGVGKRIPITMVRPSPDFKLKRKDFVVEESGTDKVLYDLESEGYLNVRGDLMNIELENEMPNVTFFKRAEYVKRYTTRAQADLHDYRSSALSLFSDKDSFSLFFKDFLYLDHQVQHNSDYFDCRYVPTQFDHSMFEKVFVCRHKITGKTVLTNFSYIQIDLGGDNLKGTMPRLIQMGDTLYFTALENGKQSIIMWKILFDLETYEHEVISRKQLFANEFLLSNQQINAYYIFKADKRNKISIFIAPAYTTSIYIREYNIDSGTFLSYENEEVGLISEGRRVLDDLVCDIKAEHVECIAKSENTLYDITLQHENTWKLRRGNVYTLYEHLATPDRFQIAFTDKYLGILFSDKKDNNILIFKRGKSEINTDVFTAVQAPKDAFISRINLIDTEATTKLYFVAFENKATDYVYSNVVVHEYHIGNMFAEIRLKGIPYRQTLKLVATGLDNQKSHKELKITYNRYFTLYLLITALVFLILLLSLLCVGAAILYKQNKKAKMEAHDATVMLDPTMYMDRTIMQV